MGPCIHGEPQWNTTLTGFIRAGGDRGIRQVACAAVARVGLETGATSTWLWTELNEMGLPVICIEF
jgi:transposase